MYVFEDQDGVREFLSNLGPLEESILIIFGGTATVFTPHLQRTIEGLKQEMIRCSAMKQVTCD